MSKRTTRTELAASLGLTPADIGHLVKAGILPARGRRGWSIDECRNRMDLAASASRFASTPSWRKFLDEFDRLAREAPAALAKAITEPTTENARSAADTANNWFKRWAFAIAVLENRPDFPASLNSISFAVIFADFSRCLAAVGQVLDDRAAVRFLN